MALTLDQVGLGTFVRMLGQLRRILDKGASHAASGGAQAGALLGARLAEDMYPLVEQVRIACDAAVDAAARLSGAEPPAFTDDEADFAALQARVDRAIAFLEGVDPASFSGAESRSVTWSARGQPITVGAVPYLLHHAMPKFYFHVATAYAILRHAGVPLKKGDYMGKV